MNFKHLLILGVLTTFAQGLWAWDGSGEETNPYKISNVNDLNELATNVNNGDSYNGKYFILTNDISNVGSFTPIGCDVNHSFQGIFDGRFYSISGMEIERTNSYNGLFGHVEGNATIKNLTLKSSIIRAERYCGGIVGFAQADYSNEKYVVITNCHVEEDVVISPIDGFNLDFGGIAGFINQGVTVSGCTCAATINDSEGSSVGGIVGECYFDGTIIDCLFTGIVRGKTECGAIVGYHFSGQPILTNNYYTSLTSMGVGKQGFSLGEDIDGALHAKEYDYVPEEIGYVVRVYGEGEYLGVVAREHGLYYDGKYYYPAQETLVLYNDQDNSEQIGLYVGRTADVKLQDRTIRMDGTWNTLILPFFVDKNAEGSILQGTELRQITTASFENGTLTLTFNEVEHVQAGEPFLMRWAEKDKTGSLVEKEDLVNPEFKNVVVGRWKSVQSQGSYVTPTPNTNYAAPTYPTTESNTENLIEFKGNYSPVTLEENDKTKLFLGTENTLYYPSANVNIGAFRCYFELLNGLTAGDPVNGVNNLVLNFGEEVTGISLNPQLSPSTSDSWFTLDGRRLNGRPMAKGIYINNGRKIIIK